MLYTSVVAPYHSQPLLGSLTVVGGVLSRRSTVQNLNSIIYCTSTAVDCRRGLATVARTCLVYIAPALLRKRSCGTVQDHCCALCSHRLWSEVGAIRGCDRLRLAGRRPSFASCQRKETCVFWKYILARTCDGGAWGLGLFMKWRVTG